MEDLLNEKNYMIANSEIIITTSILKLLTLRRVKQNTKTILNIKNLISSRPDVL